MTLTITPIYAALLALLYLWLSARVIGMRRSESVSLGFGENRFLERRIRAHGNFAEYAPFGVILLLLVELTGAPAVAVHLAGLMLLVGRVLHALALSSETPKPAFRISGMLLTFTMLAVSAVALLAHAIF